MHSLCTSPLFFGWNFNFFSFSILCVLKSSPMRWNCRTFEKMQQSTESWTSRGCRVFYCGTKFSLTGPFLRSVYTNNNFESTTLRNACPVWTISWIERIRVERELKGFRFRQNIRKLTFQNVWNRFSKGFIKCYDIFKFKFYNVFV